MDNDEHSWDNISSELNRPLDPKHVRPAQKFGPKGDYIEGWHAIAEANRIFGWDGWTREVLDCRCVQERERTMGRPGNEKPGWGVSYVMRVRVTVGVISRDGTGAGHGVDADLGLAHESAIKEAETDSMKRCLMTFGNPFGLALYDKTRANVGTDEGDPPPTPKLSDQAASRGPRDPEPETPAPDPFDIAVAVAIQHINSAKSEDELKNTIWPQYATSTVGADARVLKAKEARKKLLHFPGDDVPGTLTQMRMGR